MSDHRYAPPAAQVSGPASGDPDDSLSRKMRIGRRCFAVILILGGLFGVGVCIYLGALSNLGSALVVGFLGAFVLLFAWATLVGLRLWQGTPFGMRWAPVVFATQIPVLTVPGFQAGWFTGCELTPSIVMRAAETTWAVNANVGANVQIYFGSDAGQSQVGINLFALAAFIWLLRLKKVAAG